MRIDNSGNLLVGTTTNASGTPKVAVNGSIQTLWGQFRVATVFDNSFRQGLYFDSTARNMTIFSTTSDSGGNILFSTRNAAGASDADYGTERARIDSSGTVTINPGGSAVNNPATLLAFYGGGAATSAGPLRFGDGSLSGGATNYWDIGRDNNTTGNFTFTLNGTQKGYIAIATGVYTPVSDRRSKKNIAPLQYGLSSVMAMNPVMYHMVEELDTDKKHIGLIAQEIKAVIDEIVDDIKDETKQFYGLDKSGLVPVLIKAIQEQQALITQLTARITALEGA
jgi:hypothetical protein